MELLEAILRRRSVRKYNDKEVDEETLQCILEAGLLAPSSRNLKPVEFIVIRDKSMLHQLARAKTAGSSMLKGASCAVVVIGDSKKSDAWIEDCSIAMTYMMLRTTELGVANCWVQCRNRISQQKIGEPLSDMVEDVLPTNSSIPSERLVAQRIADNAGDNNNLSSDEFVKLLLDIPEKYSVLAILSLGMSDDTSEPHSRDKAAFSAIHEGKWSSGKIN